MWKNARSSFGKTKTKTKTDEGKSELAKQSIRKPVWILKALNKLKRDKGYHEEKNEKVIYSKLMHHLDHLEKKHWIWDAVMAAEIIVFSGLTAFLVCSLHVESINHRRRLGLRWWQYITMAMMLFSGVSVVRFVTFIVSWPLTRCLRVQKYAVYFVRQLKRCVDVTIWFCLVLLGWYLWFRPRLKHVNGDVSIIATRQATRLLIALCLGSFLWFLKNVLYLKLEADLHYDQLFDRIRLSIMYLNGILILGGEVRKTSFLTYNKRESRIKAMVKSIKRVWKTEPQRNHQVPENIWMDVLKMKRESVPIWILRRLSEEYLDLVKIKRPPEADQLLKDDEKLLTEAKKMFAKITTGKDDIFKIQQSDEIERGQLKKYKLSEQELDHIFKAFKSQGSDVYQEQGAPSGATESENIALDKFLNWAVRAHKNCWGLEHILENSKIALVKLNRLLSTFLLALVLIIWLLLSKIVTTAQLALLFAPFLAASFMFENSFKNTFQGLVFVFAMHPFDVGDRVIVDGIQMRVTELNILTSVFFKYDTGAEVIYPNSTLARKKIVNLDITPDQSDKLDFVVNFDTPPEDVKDLELTVQKLFDDDIQYSSGTKVVKNTVCIVKPDEGLKMTLYFKYLVSYLTCERKAEHRSEILGKIIRYRKEMELNKKGYPHGYEPYTLELTVSKMKLQDIEQFKIQMMSCSVLKEHYPHSKVVMTALEGEKVSMALFVRKSEYKEKMHDQNEETKQDQSQPKSQDKVNSGENMSEVDEQGCFSYIDKNLFLPEKYARSLKVVRKGRIIYSTGDHVEVIHVNPTET